VAETRQCQLLRSAEKFRSSLSYRLQKHLMLKAFTNSIGAFSSTKCNSCSFHFHCICLKLHMCCCTCANCRTDCIFSPDDRLVITGTSVKKGDGVGKLVFLDRQTLKLSAELDVAAESASPSSFCLCMHCLFNYHQNSLSFTYYMSY